ncbi:MAG TPA: hypothetical protein VGI81_10760 [Tepidisphaeraceae bacterium]
MDRHDFGMSDFVAQMTQVERLGPLSRWMGMIPGMRELTSRVGGTDAAVAKQIVRMRAIHGSMSRKERSDPDLLDGARRRRIARGAGVQMGEVSQFVKRFRMSREMMRAINRPTSSPTRTLASVLGLVSHSRSRRDPSWVHPWAPRDPWQWLVWLAVVFCIIALVAHAITAR